jgi:hypothetical protein
MVPKRGRLNDYDSQDDSQLRVQRRTEADDPGIW